VRETYPKKHRLGPQNGPRSSGPEKAAKNSKLPEMPENCFEPDGKVGGHRYPSGSKVALLSLKKCPQHCTQWLKKDINGNKN
jgi:hypothetical protein